MLSKELRGQWFRLESLARVWRNAYGKEFKPWLIKMKAIEDQIGLYSEKIEYLQFLEKVKTPAAQQERLIKQVAAERKKLEVLLPLALKDMTDFLDFARTYPWPKKKQMDQDWAQALREELKGVIPLQYDLRELQSGIHEMRRNLRWFLIYFHAFGGWMVPEFKSGPLVLNEYSTLIGSRYDTGPFARVERSPEFKNPRVIRRELFLGLSKVVEDIGVIKSNGEDIEALFLATGKRAGRVLLKAAGITEKDTYSYAFRVREELIRTHLLELFRAELKD